ncbi:RNA-directed DNA polymerase, eukaryota [Tanacetum coccineum]
MVSMRSKEDEVLKIAMSVFVTNFPDHFIANDIWNTCKKYGTVVDAFIPNRRSKVGEAHKDKRVKGYSNSYANVVRGSQPKNIEMENHLALQASNDFIIDGRVTWMEIEGIPLKMWRVKWRRCEIKNFSTWAGDSDEEAVPDTKFEEEIPRTNVEEVSVWQKDAHSADPFNLYDLLNKKQDANNKGHSVDDSLKYPPGYTPIDKKDATDEHSNKSNESKRASGECFQSTHEEEGVLGAKKSCLKNISKEDVADPICSGHFQKAEVPRLSQKAKKNWVKELCVNNKVNFLSLQETKMETIELFSIKRCWGNFAFDYVYSASVGNSGGILRVWDPKSFQKTNITVSDYFVMIRGVWVPNGKKLLIISVYAPQEFNEKKMLWDYISHVMSNWKGDVVVMGDFNEVRKKAERFGSVFNDQGADAFNLFISNAGSEEVPLGGCPFTWCHKSATKMSTVYEDAVCEVTVSRRGTWRDSTGPIWNSAAVKDAYWG